ncbi:putative zinc transporter [Lachnellula subtilissima]|uniref:Zinc transporter n=1 Tax=Lachnellula subtilissima TaxID=602034 RepID=A0A8H8U634_9HELO|nr:putative zinc transporter [Lachnellula subtilissima]
MASSYALPASAINHSHHGHGHVHSHSHSPPSPVRGYPAKTPSTLKQEVSTGHLHSLSESHVDHVHENIRAHNHNHSHAHSHEREHSHSPSLPYGNFIPPAKFETQPHDHSTHQIASYEPPVNDVHVEPHDHAHPSHKHSHAVEPQSKFTSLVLPMVLRWPLIHTIMAEKDSRRIFYFMTLNFAFMLVQAGYGYVTDSLGLLSDSIHMFFDCLALGVGLFAAVASKWPPSERFPYGFGKIESLSGFGNGVFLMMISVEIMIEATERLADGRETKRLAELFVVSALGLAVNLIGMACFGHHGHAGHDHGGHDHGHDHGHSHENVNSHDHHGHDHDHDHDHTHEHDHGNQTPLLSNAPPKAVSHTGHAHSHDNENMHGIFLHVLADTMGSAAVMLSTALIYLIGWNGWDPLASCVIAILIFMSSIPLIKSSAKKLLLTVPDDVEYNLRATLAGVSDLRGVASYTVPRFWMGDENEAEGVLGVMHIVATRGSDIDDVRERTRDFLVGKGVDVVLQVERDGDLSCWCGRSGDKRSPAAPGF